MSRVVRSIRTLVDYSGTSDDCFHTMNAHVIKLPTNKDTFQQPIMCTLILKALDTNGNYSKQLLAQQLTLTSMESC